MPRLIGIYSSPIEQGSNTVAEILERDFDFIRVNFSDPAKAMVESFLHYSGQDPKAVELLMNQDRNEPTDSPYEQTTSHLVNTLMREWGEACIGPLVWTELWFQAVNYHLKNGRHVVCSDLCSEDRVAMVRELGGNVWQVGVRTVLDYADFAGKVPDWDKTLAPVSIAAEFAELVNRALNYEIGPEGWHKPREDAITKMLDDGEEAAWMPDFELKPSFSTIDWKVIRPPAPKSRKSTKRSKM